jgi:hypothetical protein
MKRTFLFGACLMGFIVSPLKNMTDETKYGQSEKGITVYNNQKPDDSRSQEPDSSGKFGPLKRICAGVNIHFTKGHQKDLDMIAAAGFKFIRMDFVWHDIETSHGIYNWDAYDELTSNLDKRGLRAIYILDYSNPLYEEEVESKDPITGEAQKGIAAPHHEESVAAFVRWAATAATRYKESNIIWEIWNEPNITFWRPAPDVTQYNTLAIATCKAVKYADPNSIIIGPATSQIPFPFIESVLASGLPEYLDAVSVHPYRDYSLSPETAAGDYDKLRELIDRYTPEGRMAIPVISSEWGYSSATRGLSTETQAAYIVRMQLSNLINNIPVSIWYDWKNDGEDPGNFEHNCGTVSYDLKPKPAYIAVQTMNKQLGGFTFIKRIKVESENDFILLFRNDKGTCKIIAWTMDQAHSFVVKMTGPKVAGPEAKNWKGDDLPVKAAQGMLQINIDGFPQYITLPPGSEV